jgi:hypothetical protein
MHPILFEIGPIKIFTYGFLLAVAFLSAIFVAGREAKRLAGIPGIGKKSAECAQARGTAGNPGKISLGGLFHHGRAAGGHRP